MEGDASQWEADEWPSDRTAETGNVAFGCLCGTAAAAVGHGCVVIIINIM